MSRTTKFVVYAFGLAAGLAARADAAGKGVEPDAQRAFHIGALPVTNSIIMTWAVAAGLLFFLRLIVGKPSIIPSRGQAVLEDVIQGIRDIVDPIVGVKAIKATFPLLIGLFVYILIQNWSGLIPGVGTIYMTSHGHWMELLRPANADMNGTFALAFVSFAAWLYLIFRYAGLKAILSELFGNKADKREVPPAIYYPLIPIFLAAGVLECVSIAFRPISLSFRLFGNIFGGENLMHSMSAISRWGLPIPFYFMEVLVGLVQAFIFMLLVAVYVGLMCNHGDSHGAESPSHGGGH